MNRSGRSAASTVSPCSQTSESCKTSRSSVAWLSLACKKHDCRCQLSLIGHARQSHDLRTVRRCPTELADDIRVAFRSPIFYGPLHTSTTTLATGNELTCQALFVDAHAADSRKSASVVRLNLRCVLKIQHTNILAVAQREAWPRRQFGPDINWVATN